MKKKILALILLFAMLSSLWSCANKNTDSTFSIQFIDVGQGDSALIECDGRYMLIDGGDVSAGDKVYSVLEERGVQELDILAISHLHKDHFGGLTRALTYVREIGKTISNEKDGEGNAFGDFEYELHRVGSEITVPVNGKEFKLGSAMVKVLDVCADEDNDSLVLLITYEKTRFLFTGDIGRNGQLRVVDALKAEKEFDGLSLIKMPHHGAYNDKLGFMENALDSLFRVYDPSYFIISVGLNNQYKHPHQETIKIIENLVVRVKELEWNDHVFRTDEDGDIIVKSNGKEISVETLK